MLFDDVPCIYSVLKDDGETLEFRGRLPTKTTR